MLRELPPWARAVFKNWAEGISVEDIQLERRNPFALAHMVNHPPKGESPNTIVPS